MEKGRFLSGKGGELGPAVGREESARRPHQGSLQGVRGRTRPLWDLSLCLRCPLRSERNAGCCLEEAPCPLPALPLIQSRHLKNPPQLTGRSGSQLVADLNRKNETPQSTAGSKGKVFLRNVGVSDMDVCGWRMHFSWWVSRTVRANSSVGRFPDI